MTFPANVPGYDLTKSRAVRAAATALLITLTASCQASVSSRHTSGQASGAPAASSIVPVTGSSSPTTTSAPTHSKAPAAACEEVWKQPRPAPAGTSSTSRVKPISAALAHCLEGTTLRSTVPDCAPASQLHLLEVPYRNFNDQIVYGQLIISVALAPALGKVFDHILRDTRFQIEHILLPEAVTTVPKSEDPQVGRLVDNQIMELNLTSGYNCRAFEQGGIDKHGNGIALDINPVQNPMTISNPKPGEATLSPAAAVKYRQQADFTKEPHRRRILGRKYQDGGAVIALFEAAGYTWGGCFLDPDMQHFDHRSDMAVRHRCGVA